MRIILSILITTLLSTAAFATGQEGERLIIGQDTAELLSEPLYPYLMQHKEVFEKEPLLIQMYQGCSTALWRGYVGLWQIKNDSLFLVDVFLCGRKGRSIKHLIFPNTTTEVWASWYSEDLIIPKGKPIIYNHSGFSRLHEKTLKINVKKGVVTNSKEHINGYRSDDTGLSRKPYDILGEIYQKIEWSKFNKLSKKIRVYTTFDINEEGVVSNIQVEPESCGGDYSEELQRVLSSLGRFKILHWNGENRRSSFGASIEFSKKEKKKYARQQQ